MPLQHMSTLGVQYAINLLSEEYIVLKQNWKEIFHGSQITISNWMSHPLIDP